MSDDNVMDWHQYSLECNAPMLGNPSGEQPQPSRSVSWPAGSTGG